MAGLRVPSGLRSPGTDEVLFKNYVPPARDAVRLPIRVLCVLLATVVIVMTLYAIIGHLIKDLFHDLADWLFGEQLEEEQMNFLETRDKFVADWCPETSPELEELARAEQIKVVMEGECMPAIWVIPDGVEPGAARSTPRVAFGKTT